MPACPICHLDLDDASLTLECGHSFHAACVLSWFRSEHDSHGTCPLCRHSPAGAPYAVSTDVSMMRLVCNAARRKRASNGMKLAYAHMRAERAKRVAARAAVRCFDAEHRDVLRCRRKLVAQLCKSIASERLATRTLCRLHPIVPIVVRSELHATEQG